MAIQVRLDDLLHERRMTLTELADRVGITLANLSILKTGKAKAVRFSTLFVVLLISCPIAFYIVNYRLSALLLSTSYPSYNCNAF